MKKFAVTALACLLLPALAGCDEGQDDFDDLAEGASEMGEDEEEDEQNGPEETREEAGEGEEAGESAGQGEDPPPQEPTGEACDLFGTPVEECSDGTFAYCSNYSDGPTQFGPCLAAEEIECSPGEHKDLGPHSDEWEQEVCGNRYAICEVWEGEPEWREQYCNTPLVLSFDQASVEFIEAEATPAASFDITMQDEACLSTDWPTAATPWLALDRDGNGSIDGGDELFGSGTRLRGSSDHARNGFAALAELDANGDGLVDARDPRFGELLLWRDHDADRRSLPGELEPLSSAGVQALPVSSAKDAECDARGNCAALGGLFESSAGVGQVVDVYLGCQ